MPTSKAQQKAVSKYMKENYDEIKVRVEKGRKDVIKAHAEARGESVNGFISRAIEHEIARDNKRDRTGTASLHTLYHSAPGQTNCPYCQGQTDAQTVKFIVDLGLCVVIVKNVPARICQQCGETSYSSETAQKLDQIMDTVKQSKLSEAAMIDYLNTL